MKYKFSVAISVIIVTQFLVSLLYINYPFFDGRIHYNWGPSFWLLQAEKINSVGLTNTYFGTKDYPAHPQLIGPVVSSWTKIFGYSEGSIRTLPLLLTIISTLFLSLAIRKFLGDKKALAFALIFASLPLVYIYGKKLDQEALVLLFLGIYLYGISKINFSEKFGWLVSSIGVLGMALSDWSGLVFSAFLGVTPILAWKWKEDKNKIIKLFLISLVFSIAGLIIFLVQSYLQANSPGINQFFHNYYELWRYRAGMTVSLSWCGWFAQQIRFLSINYSIPIFIVAILAIIKSLKTKDSNVKIISYFVTSILLGSLFYMIFLPQASGIHIYYQYFLSVPIAYGIIVAIDEIVKLFKTKNIEKTWTTILIYVFMATSLYTAYQYNQLLFHSSGSKISDIELIKKIKNIPEDKTIIAADIDQMALFWYDNPNIQYYTGRTIKGYLLEDGVPLADYQLIPRSQSTDYIKAVNSGGYGPKIIAKEISCSDNICLLNLIKK